MEIHNHILTDLKNVRWSGIDLDSVKRSLNELANTPPPLYGEVVYAPFRDIEESVDLSRISHTITQIYLDENEKVIRGNIKFIDTPMGILAQTAYVNYGFQFRIRVFGMEESNQMVMLLLNHPIITWTKIITWDLVQKNNGTEDYLNSITDFFQY